MTKAQILPVSVDEAEAIAEIVRQADIDEIVEGLGLDMVHTLKVAFGSSCKASKVVIGGQIVAVFGDAMHDVTLGVPWLVSTVHVNAHARRFLRLCRQEIIEMLGRHERLLNFVDARNTHAIRWLKWLGFEFGDAIAYGPLGLPFYPFEMNREV